jgi:hypothetical protein
MSAYPSHNPVSPSPSSVRNEAKGVSRGPSFRVAVGIDEVVAAWQLVYTAYRRKDLISPNRHRLHTSKLAASRHSGVILGRVNQVIVSTLTAMADSDDGLPLDSVYAQEMADLRRRVEGQGRSLVQVGLFADRRKELSRSTESLFQLMQYAYYYAYWRRADIVIGVHPRHSRFYTQTIGFETNGPTRSYPTVNHNPVCLMHLDIEGQLKRKPMPVGLDYFSRNHVTADTFEGRFGFEARDVADSPLGTYLGELDDNSPGGPS